MAFTLEWFWGAAEDTTRRQPGLPAVARLRPVRPEPGWEEPLCPITPGTCQGAVDAVLGHEVLGRTDLGFQVPAYPVDCCCGQFTVLSLGLSLHDVGTVLPRCHWACPERPQAWSGLARGLVWSVPAASHDALWPMYFVSRHILLLN